MRYKRILTVLIILTVTFIWGNSLLPPEASWAVSNAVKEVILALLPGEGGSGGAGTFGSLLRKMAHFTEFCVLGGLLRAQWKGRKNEIFMPLFLGLLTAVIDETIQAFTGRTSSVFDVWIDFSGVIIGTALITGWFYWLKGHRSKFK